MVEVDDCPWRRGTRSTETPRQFYHLRPVAVPACHGASASSSSSHTCTSPTSLTSTTSLSGLCTCLAAYNIHRISGYKVKDRLLSGHTHIWMFFRSLHQLRPT